MNPSQIRFTFVRLDSAYRGERLSLRSLLTSAYHVLETDMDYVRTRCWCSGPSTLRCTSSQCSGHPSCLLSEQPCCLLLLAGVFCQVQAVMLAFVKEAGAMLRNPVLALYSDSLRVECRPCPSPKSNFDHVSSQQSCGCVSRAGSCLRVSAWLPGIERELQYGSHRRAAA